jgi:solute carrier family 13 (sodium-dependent dicarboxylate transporter), member 2/3/5
MAARPAHPWKQVVQWTGLVAAPGLALATYALLPDSYLGAGGREVAFGHAGRTTAATAVWMALWWMSEAIPVYATALLPLVVLPLTGAASMRAAATPYAHELIFLFMGGFIVALCMERWGLHRRISLLALRAVGPRPRNAIGGFMLVTAGLSMWVSNTATTVMMLPIALSVIDLLARQLPQAQSHGARGDAANFSQGLLLGIAYAASIGGIGTLIGTPPNLLLASFAKSELGVEISFVSWLAVGLPLVALLLPLAWWLLTAVLHPVRTQRIEGHEELVHAALAELGPMSRGERVSLATFVAMAAAWILRPLLVGWGLSGLSDAGIAMTAALALFVIPIDARRRVFAMDWETAVRLPWGVLVLFGGGLSLAAAIGANGVGELLGHQVATLGALPGWLVVVTVVVGMVGLTELTSNTAATATLLPILAGIAPGLGLDPLLLAVPAAIAASCAFVLPVATPPNAVVFGTGHVTMGAMIRAGCWLDTVCCALVPLIVYALAMPVLRG